MSFPGDHRRWPRLRGKLRFPVALPVTALPARTRRLGWSVFWSGGLVGTRAGGGKLPVGFLPGERVAFSVGNGRALRHAPNPALQATGRMKPRPSPELARWALTGESA